MPTLEAQAIRVTAIATVRGGVIHQYMNERMRASTPVLDKERWT
jgi:hypothetical protein